MKEIKIVLDAITTDGNLDKVIIGSVKALKELPNLKLYLVGPIDEINNQLKLNDFTSDNLIIIDAQDKITNFDNPIKAIRQKKESSLYKCFDLLKQNEDIEGLVSAGSTGALLCGAIMNLQPIGKCYPSLSTLLPNENDEFFCLIDCGANVDCTPKQLLEYAEISSCYMKCMYPNKDIKVGLLSNGTEDTKGNLLTKEVFQLLKESDVNFIGNIEGTDILTGKCDIVVCDGFIGNIVLKNIEGSLKMVIKQLVKKAKTTNDEMEKKYLLKTVNELLSKYDLNSLSGATLLGVDKVIMKGHGNANENTIYNIVKQVYNLINNNLITNLKNEFNNK